MYQVYEHKNCYCSQYKINDWRLNSHNSLLLDNGYLIRQYDMVDVIMCDSKRAKFKAEDRTITIVKLD